MWVLEILPNSDESQQASASMAVASDTPSIHPSGTASQRTTSPKKKRRGPFHLVAGDFVVGRKDCEIVINWDKSVSRQHAKVSVRELKAEDVSHVGTTQAIEVTDMGSKFLTRVNDEPLTPQTPRALRAGDVLTFGNVVKARLRLLPLVFCLSRVSAAGRTKLQQSAAQVGAHVVNKWGPTCTHLMVEQYATATSKVGFAVIHCKPVVDVTWLTEGVVGRASVALPLPDPRSFRPDWSKVSGWRQLEQDRLHHFEDYAFVFALPDDTEELVRDAGAEVERAYQWEEADVTRMLQELVRNKKAVVLVDPEKNAAAALAEKIESVSGVYMANKHGIATSIFGNRVLKGKNHKVVEEEAAAARAALSAATAIAAAATTTEEPTKKGKEKEKGKNEEASVDTAAPPPPPPPQAPASAPPPSPSSSATKKTRGKRRGADAAIALEQQQATITAAEEQQQQQQPPPSPFTSPRRRTTRSTPAAAEAAPTTTTTTTTTTTATPTQTHTPTPTATPRTTRARGKTTAATTTTASAPTSPTRASARKRRQAGGEEGEGEEGLSQEGGGGGGREQGKGKGKGGGRGKDKQGEVEVEEVAVVAAAAPASASPRRASKRGRKEEVVVVEEEGGGAAAAAAAAAAAEQQEKEPQKELEKATSTNTSTTPGKRGRDGAKKATSTTTEPPTTTKEQETETETEPKKQKTTSATTTTTTTAPPLPPSSTSKAKPFKIRQPTHNPPASASSPIKRLDPAEGWLVAPRKAPAAGGGGGGGGGGRASQEDGEGGSSEEEEEEGEGGGGEGRGRGGRRRAGGGEEEEHGEGEGEDGLLEGETLVEERDLVAGAPNHHHHYQYYDDESRGEEVEPMQHIDPSRAAVGGGGGGHFDSNKPNFKRFRKNRVRMCEGQARLGKAALIAVLPKESEMEVQLRNEEALEFARKEEAERLFDDKDQGPKRRRR